MRPNPPSHSKALDETVSIPVEGAAALGIGTSAPVGSRTVAFFLRQIGRTLCAPAYASLALQDHALASLQGSGVVSLSTPVRARLADLALYSNSSPDGVAAFAECVMMLRSLARRNSSIRECLSRMITIALAQLPKVIKKLQTFGVVDEGAAAASLEMADVPEDSQSSVRDAQCALDTALFESIFVFLGCLSTFGGFTQPLCVGSQVRLLSQDACGTVVSRDAGAKVVSVVRDGTVTEEPTKAVVNLGVPSLAFDVNEFQTVNTTQALTSLSEVDAARGRPYG